MGKPSFFSRPTTELVGAGPRATSCVHEDIYSYALEHKEQAFEMKQKHAQSKDPKKKNQAARYFFTGSIFFTYSSHSFWSSSMDVSPKPAW